MFLLSSNFMVDFEIDFKKAIDYVPDFPLPRMHETHGNYRGERRSFQIVGLLSFYDGTPVTSYTLGERVNSRDVKCLTDGEALNILNLSSVHRWNKKYALAPHAALMEIVNNSHDDPELFNMVKGVRMLTNTVALRKNGKLQLGYKPIFGEDNKVWLDGKENVDMDVEGKAFYLGKESWFAPDDSTSSHTATYCPDVIQFYSKRDGVHLPEASVSIVITDDKKTHVFSNNSLSHRDVNTRFPIVKL